MDLEASSFGTMMLLTAMAAAAMPVGGWLAMIGSLRPGWLDEELRHTILAFGGGVLLAAIALVLIPEGAEGLSSWKIGMWFVAGGTGFMMLDIWLAKRRTPASQMAAMLADFLPESLAMGAAFAQGHASGFSLALLIALQNLPEGFNAFREMAGRSRVRGRRVLIVMACMVPLGPIMGWLGMSWLAPHPELLHGIMIFAAGGILYAIFQDIAPQVKLARHWGPPMGAVAGFLVGLLGNLWIEGAAI
ncbi:MAG: divalent cation transporter [Verrucomicrobiae bacterium]|nr:divalent cation transporter [Verrucomicrobiae bacterium]